MKKVIFRYEIPVMELTEDGRFMLDLPLGARILHLGVQERAPHAPCMWVLVNADDRRPPVPRPFVLVGTGHPLEGLHDHVGTFQQHGFVWNVFEVPS